LVDGPMGRMPMDVCTDACGEEDEDAEVECAICLISAGSDPRRFVTFGCSHRFCVDCVTKHVHSNLAGQDSDCRCAQCSQATHPVCPLCRRPLSAADILASVVRK